MITTRERERERERGEEREFKRKIIQRNLMSS